MNRPSHPRVLPLDAANLSSSLRPLVSAGASNVLLTLARHEELLKGWLALGQTLLFSERVAPRQRELAVLRVALRTECAYEWANHVLAAQSVGVSAAEIRALAADTDTATWAESEAALLRAVDELCSTDCVSDQTWLALAATRSEVQLIETLCLIGYYRMNAGLLNALGVQPEPGRPRFGEVPEVPAHVPSATSDASAISAPSGARTGAPPRAGVVDDSVDGTWHVVFHHPTGDQQLTIELTSSTGTLSGSVTNPAQGVTLRIRDGSASAGQFRFRAPLEAPVAVDITYTGAVHGDRMAGDVAIHGAGTFPFDGARA